MLNFIDISDSHRMACSQRSFTQGALFTCTSKYFNMSKSLVYFDYFRIRGEVLGFIGEITGERFDIRLRRRGFNASSLEIQYIMRLFALQGVLRQTTPFCRHKVAALRTGLYV